MQYKQVVQSYPIIHAPSSAQDPKALSKGSVSRHTSCRTLLEKLDTQKIGADAWQFFSWFLTGTCPLAPSTFQE